MLHWCLRTFLFYQIFGNTTATHKLLEQQEVKTKAGSHVLSLLPPQISEASLQVEILTLVFTRFRLGHLALLPQTELLQTPQLQEIMGTLQILGSIFISGGMEEGWN